ncbi:hypothetical protein ABBQ38_012416 [Trebouxia sp. C0009 RCD-2024]
MPLLPVFLINRPGEIPQYHQKYVVDLILEVTSDLTNKPPGLDHWQQLLAGPVVISGVQSSHVNSIQALDKWNIEHQDPQFLSSVVRWGCTLAVYAHDLLRSSGAAVAEKGRIVVMSTLVLRTFLMLSQLPRVTRDGDAFAVTMQVLTGLKYKCSLTHRPFPLVQILDSIQTKTAAAPACWVKAQEAFQECMTKAGKFLDIPGILKEPKAKEALMRVLAVDLTEIFLGSRAKRPLAMTCRDALPLVLSLEKSAFRLSEQTPLNIFADDFAKVHGHPAREAQEFYDTHKSRTGANLTLARSVILNGSMQELVECSTSWPYGAPFAINPRSFAVLTAFAGGFTGSKAKHSGTTKLPCSSETRRALYDTYMKTDSQQDPELAAMEELQHVVTGQEGGPVRLTEEERKQVEEGLAERPDLHEFVSQSLAQQAGGDVPIALPWNDVKAADLRLVGPRMQLTALVQQFEADTPVAIKLQSLVEEWPDYRLIDGGC